MSSTALAPSPCGPPRAAAELRAGHRAGDVGARLDAEDLIPFRDHAVVIGLAEMMNVPGVLQGDSRVLAKLAAFQRRAIDGHAPLLRERELNAYATASVRNDHESTSREEALDKLRRGLQVLIREGSAAKDVETFGSLIAETTSPFLAFCTDDRNPLDIVEQDHIDHCIRKALAAGAPVAAVYRVASWSAARGFGLIDRGLIAPGYQADIVLLDDLDTCAIHTVIRAGQVVDDALFARRRLVPPVGYGSVIRSTRSNWPSPLPGRRGR